MDPAMALEVEAMSRQRAAEDAAARGDSAIQQWYAGASALITGGSGFLGKQLTEKLLRSCDVNKIYLLLRTKKGKNPKQRLTEVLADPVFEKVRRQKPNFADKLVVVHGDVAEVRLGLDDHDWKTVTEEVNVIFHVAATTRFNDPLRFATLTNVRGTREALRLGTACKNLRSFVHVSTAFSNATGHRGQVLEQFYSSPVPPDLLIHMAETFDEATLDAIAPQLLRGGWINIYTVTKMIAEEAVRQMAGELPVCVVRPSIVICSYRDPVPGWLDISCAYGASGLLAGLMSGVVHTLPRDVIARYDLVPVDLVNNAVVAAAWQAAHAHAAEPTIYTITAKRNPILGGDFDVTLRSLKETNNSSKSLWYPCAVSIKNRFLFWLTFWLFHYIPAYIADGVGLVMGKRLRVVHRYTKGYSMITTLSPFLLNHWEFGDTNVQNLQRSLSPTDRQIFNFDVTSVDNKEFLRIWWMGTRRYILKEGKEIIDSDFGNKRLFWLRILHYVGCALYVYLLWKIFSFAFYLRLPF